MKVTLPLKHNEAPFSIDRDSIGNTINDYTLTFVRCEQSSEYVNDSTLHRDELELLLENEDSSIIVETVTESNQFEIKLYRDSDATPVSSFLVNNDTDILLNIIDNVTTMSVESIENDGDNLGA